VCFTARDLLWIYTNRFFRPWPASSTLNFKDAPIEPGFPLRENAASRLDAAVRLSSQIRFPFWHISAATRAGPPPHRQYVNHDNTVRLHCAIGYITPQDKLLGKEKAIFAARDQKLAQARRQRKIKRQNQPALSLLPQPDFSS
jgi:hypothetical protein